MTPHSPLPPSHLQAEEVWKHDKNKVVFVSYFTLSSLWFHHHHSRPPTHSLLFLFSLHAELRENQKQIKPPLWFLPPFLLSTKSRVSAVEFEESFLISVVCFFQFPQVVEEDHHGFGRKSWWKNWSAYAVQTLVRAGGTISFFFLVRIWMCIFP